MITLTSASASPTRLSVSVVTAIGPDGDRRRTNRYASSKACHTFRSMNLVGGRRWSTVGLGRGEAPSLLQVSKHCTRINCSAFCSGESTKRVSIFIERSVKA